MRIVSLLPSATEIVYALGLEDDLVGVTHECDWPPAALGKRHVSSSALPPGASAAEIDSLVSASIGEGEPIYRLDTEAIQGASSGSRHIPGPLRRMRRSFGLCERSAGGPRMQCRSRISRSELARTKCSIASSRSQPRRGPSEGPSCWSVSSGTGSTLVRAAVAGLDRP